MILRASLGVLGVGTCLFCAVSEAAIAKRWTPKVEDRWLLEPTYYIEDVGQDTSQVSTPIRYQMDLSFRPVKEWRLRFSPWFYSDPASRSSRELLIPDLSEAAADYQAGDWSFKFGINRFAWGITDVVNPLDVVSARRYIDLLNSEKRGTPSVDVVWERDEWRLEAVYVPYQFESIMPGDKSRWLPRDVAYNRSVGFDKIFLADRFSYESIDRREIDDALRNNFGFRTDYRGSGLDLTAIAFQGAPTAPAMLTPIVSGTLISSAGGLTFQADNITLQPTYYLRRTVGAGAVVTLEEWIFRFAYANSDRLSNLSGLPGWSQTAVVNAESNFAAPFSSTLTVLAQASYANHEDQADNFITSLDRIFDRALMLGLRLSTSSEWSFSGAGLYDGAHSGGFAQLKAERRLSDRFTSAISADWFDGVAGSPLGTYRGNKRVILSLTVY